jgi:short-subunit dehydrogenase
MKTKTALVTGASSGIGYVFAKELAKEGYTVTCVARNEEKLKNLVDSLGGNHRYITADLTDINQLNKVSQDILDTGYSLLVNNAGYGMYDRFENIPLDKYEKMMVLNMNAVVHLSFVFLKNSKPGDALINLSTILSRLAFPGSAVYVASKTFVNSLTESLWYEYKDKGVYVMALQPGLTKTGFHSAALGEKQAHLPKVKYTPESVVSTALKALKKRKKPCVICGRKYKILAFLGGRLLSRKKMITMMGKKSPGLRR